MRYASPSNGYQVVGHWHLCCATTHNFRCCQTQGMRKNMHTTSYAIAIKRQAVILINKIDGNKIYRLSNMQSLSNYLNVDLQYIAWVWMHRGPLYVVEAIIWQYHRHNITILGASVTLLMYIFNSSTLGNYGIVQISNSLSTIKTFAVIVKLLSCDCHWTWLMSNQNWFW